MEQLPIVLPSSVQQAAHTLQIPQATSTSAQCSNHSRRGGLADPQAVRCMWCSTLRMPVLVGDQQAANRVRGLTRARPRCCAGEPEYADDDDVVRRRDTAVRTTVREVKNHGASRGAGRRSAPVGRAATGGTRLVFSRRPEFGNVSAQSLLMTALGEYVLPKDRPAWTSASSGATPPWPIASATSSRPSLRHDGIQSPAGSPWIERHRSSRHGPGVPKLFRPSTMKREIPRPQQQPHDRQVHRRSHRMRHPGGRAARSRSCPAGQAGQDPPPSTRRPAAGQPSTEARFVVVACAGSRAFATS